jgi:hypothetical protein
MKTLHTVSKSVRELVVLLLVLATCAAARSQSGNVTISSNTIWTSGSYQLTSLTVNWSWKDS